MRPDRRLLLHDAAEPVIGQSQFNSSFTLYRGTPPGVRLGDYGSCLGFSIVSSTADDIDTPVSKQAFTYLDFGYGSAIAFLLTAIILVLSGVQWRFFRPGDDS